MPNPDATQPSPQPAEDLERGLDRGPYSLPSPLTADELEQLEIAWFQGQEPEWWLTNIPPGDLGSTYAIARLVTTIRAALARERELREALGEYGQHHHICEIKYSHATDPNRGLDACGREADCTCGWIEKRKRLLGEQAVGGHVGSFFASEYGNPNVPPTGWHWTCSCGESSGRLYSERSEAVSGHNVHRSEALLAQPAAGKERERG